MIRDRIVVEPPSDPARMERMEREVLARIDAEPARATEKAAPARGYRWAFAGAAFAAAAAVVLWWAWPRPAALPAKPVVAEPSMIVTPPGNGSQVALAGVVVDVAADTAVEVQPGPDGALTLDLRRGAVDCDVTPRAGRPPFVVLAGDVRVEVVGTRFTVTRGDAVRVEVTRGKVRVLAPDGEHLVAAGERWPAEPATKTAVVVPQEPEPPPPAPPAPAPAPTTPRKKPAPPSSQDIFADAQKLARTDRDAAAAKFREAARGKDGWAALALHNLAELEWNRGHRDDALDALDDYERRFPRGANAEDAAWLRVEIHQGARDTKAARAAAKRYLERFPDGTYAVPAGKLVP